MRPGTIEAILDRKIIAILRGVPAEFVEPLAGALYAGGIALMEVTFDQARVEDWDQTARSIARIDAQFQGRVMAGAGTVLTLEQVELAHRAGARYIISPNADAAIIARTVELGMVSIPGCFTPTEAVAAHNAGADFIKLFPAGLLGTGYVRALRGPLNHLRLMAVGGVNPGNAGEFMRAGCCGLGIASGLYEPEWLKAGTYERVTERARAFVEAARI